MVFRKILVVDFDGTIVENKYPELGPLKTNVVEVLNRLYDEGYGILINTCRCQEFEHVAKKCLKNNGIKYHYMNCNFPHLIKHYGMDCRKLSGDIYIDDKNLMGIPDDWEEIYKIIKSS